MDHEKQKQIYRKKLRSQKKQRKKIIKYKKMAKKRREKKDLNANLRGQLKEQLSPTFNRGAYLPNKSKSAAKNVLKVDKFDMQKWQPPQP